MATIPPVITNAGVWDAAVQYPYGSLVSYSSAFYANGNVDQLPSPLVSLPSATPAFWVEISASGGGGITSILAGDNINVSGTSVVTVGLEDTITLSNVEVNTLLTVNGALSAINGTGDTNQVLAATGLATVEWVDLPFSYITGVIENANAASWTESPALSGFYYSDFDINSGVMTANSIITVTMHDTDPIVGALCWIITTKPILQGGGGYFLRVHCAASPANGSASNPTNLPVNFAWIISQIA
jgi:hypothetical protein